MLILALVMVNALRLTGVIELLGNGLAPLFVWLGLPSEVMLAVITKYIAGGTAMMGVTAEFINQGVIDSRELNRLAGFLIHPLDIAGIAVLISAGRRVASVLKPALWGAFAAILIRALIHGLIY
jgi:spore maturation protein SpmB